MNNKEIYINGSLSCIDLTNIKEQMELINKSDIHSLHYDVVDGEFNDCFCFGDLMLGKMRPLTNKKICVHLACNNVEKYIEPMIRNGADYIAIHYETKCDHFALFDKIQQLGAKPVLAFKCDTGVPDDFIEMAKRCEWVLKLTVNPGYAGQKFKPEVIDSIKGLRKALDDNYLNDILIETDGNMSLDNAPIAVKAGANIITGGSSGLFNQVDSIDNNYKKLYDVCINALSTRKAVD